MFFGCYSHIVSIHDHIMCLNQRVNETSVLSVAASGFINTWYCNYIQAVHTECVTQHGRNDFA